ncbi:MAG: hypothetical protein MUO76_19645 [Anaerolineaceae bacterium]|nr:hypothetical protein [Anaerolineaceae bacterium]
MGEVTGEDIRAVDLNGIFGADDVSIIEHQVVGIGGESYDRTVSRDNRSGGELIPLGSICIDRNPADGLRLRGRVEVSNKDIAISVCVPGHEVAGVRAERDADIAVFVLADGWGKRIAAAGIAIRNRNARDQVIFYPVGGEMSSNSS